MSLKKSILVIFLILLADQIIKIYVKTHFIYEDEVVIFSWFKLQFIENNGMAWGVQIPGEYGKLILTVFRLFAISGIGYWLWDSARKNAPGVLMISIALIFAGAFGNIIDSVFYGLIFEESGSQVAQIFPEGGGYGKLFHGKVVDMFRFSFFSPIFNLADFAISVGVGIIIVFNRKAFPKTKKTEEVEEVEEVAEVEN